MFFSSKKWMQFQKMFWIKKTMNSKNVGELKNIRDFEKNCEFKTCSIFFKYSWIQKCLRVQKLFTNFKKCSQVKKMFAYFNKNYEFENCSIFEKVYEIQFF